MIKNHPIVAHDVVGMLYIVLNSEALRQKFLDPEERVRICAIKAFDEFDMETLGSVSMICLKDLSHRCRDKKVFTLVDNHLVGTADGSIKYIRKNL